VEREHFQKVDLRVGGRLLCMCTRFGLCELCLVGGQHKYVRGRGTVCGLSLQEVDNSEKEITIHTSSYPDNNNADIIHCIQCGIKTKILYVQIDVLID